VNGEREKKEREPAPGGMGALLETTLDAKS
jgi:hypothetical protein